MADRNLPLTGHLDDLRKVVVRCLIALVITTSLSYAAFGDRILDLITIPLKEAGVGLIYIGMTEAFMTKIKLSLLAGFILALPFIFLQVWNFVAPALYPRERRAIVYILPLSLILFGAGAVFAYLVVFKYAALFLLTVVSGDVKPMISVAHYVSFLISFLLPFGLVFELPLASFFLTKVGILNHHFLVRYRKMSIIGIAVLAAILTPGPDVISQVLLALPMILLYELSIIISRVVAPRDIKVESESC